jgi:hypothetical protein
VSYRFTLYLIFYEFSFVDLFDWEKENDVQYYALLAHKKKDIDDWYQETEEKQQKLL